MGKDFEKRIAKLKSQTDASRKYQISFDKAFWLSFISISIITFIFFSPADVVIKQQEQVAPQASDSHMSDIIARLEGTPQRQQLVQPTENSWQRALEISVEERIALLDSAFLPWVSGESYLGFAQNLVGFFIGDLNAATQIQAADPRTWFAGFLIWLAKALLRIGFIVIAFWPIWVMAAIGGYFIIRAIYKPRPTEDILGICDQGKGPFYSGIYGPLKPNGSFSGMDFSAPGLACPKIAPKAAAQGHRLGRLLTKYRALNDTTTSLVGIILAYAKFPALVDEERAAEDVCDVSSDKPQEAKNKGMHIGIVSNQGGTIEQSAVIGLRAVLEAHASLVHLAKRISTEKSYSESDEFFKYYYAFVEEVKPSLSELGGILLTSLTPQRGFAIANLSIKDVAAAYLAIEAGKCLVYKEVEGGFAQLSRYPHLQARAVIQSLVEYHREYSGDERMIIRQAMISARRHGDFGRAQIPINMHISARALRDWLEILYTAPQSRKSIGHIVELDAHLHEVHLNFKQKYAAYIQGLTKAKNKQGELSRGVPYKSIVLLRLNDLTNIALNGIANIREARITSLMQETRAFQARLSISARLPGFKRQAEEAEKSVQESGGVTQLLAQNEKDKDIVSKWLIMRRMLTRYNWLSTRIGDDSVPTDGLVQAIVRQESSRSFGLNALVPLRQRRFKELLGTHWYKNHYADSLKENTIQVFIDNEAYLEALSKEQTQNKEGSAVAQS